MCQTLMRYLEEEDRKKIKEFLQDVKKGEWKEKTLEDGKTNHIILYQNGDRKIIARVFGRETKDFINRQREWNNIKMLASYSLVPEVKGDWANGYLLNYIEGRALEHNELKKYYKLIAKKMKKFHSIHVYGSPILFDTLSSWYWRAYVNHRKILMDYDIRKIIDIGQERSQGCQIVFCHNDLLASNILIRNESIRVSNTGSHSIGGGYFEDEIKSDLKISSNKDSIGTSPLTEKIKSIEMLEKESNQEKVEYNLMKQPDVPDEKLDFIDFEYSGVNFASFDIANHIREHIGYSLDIKKFPDDAFIRQFLREYFNDIIDVNQSIIEKTLKEVKFFMPLSDCMWFLWALLKSDTEQPQKKTKLKTTHHQVGNNEELTVSASGGYPPKKSSGFDYLGYAMFRLSLIPSDLTDWHPDH